MSKKFPIPDGFEYRILTDQPIEVREDGEGKPVSISGYAAVFNSESSNFGSQEFPIREIIEPTFFKSVLSDDVRALINHDGLPLARTISKTLRLSVDEIGLRYEFEPDADITVVADLVRAMKRGDINQSSFAFRVGMDGQRWVEENSKVTRYLTKAERLFDVSIVTFPAYPDTSVALRSLEAFREERSAALNHEKEQAEARRRKLQLLEI